jgi:F0F1-type ATP synthase membrane subunit b/b'
VELWQLALIITSVLAATLAFVWNAVRLAHHHHATTQAASNTAKTDSGGEDAKLFHDVKHDVEHIFDDEFREELRNRGRLHFEKIINENAMFLQQDLRLTTSQVNEYMKQEITKTLQEEFSKYEQSITDAKQLAIESIEKTRTAIEQQREILGEQLEAQVKAEKERLIGRFEKNMAEIINHYVVSAIGNQIDLEDQLEYILGDLQANKKEILDDIQSGA